MKSEETTSTAPPPVRMSREAALAFLREKLKEMADDDHSVCQIAAQHGILCRGFQRYSDAELQQRYWWLAGRRPEMTRERLEALANRWQLGRQIYHDVELSCDVQSIERDTCLGWDDITNEMLQQFCRDLAGMEVEITA